MNVPRTSWLPVSRMKPVGSRVETTVQGDGRHPAIRRRCGRWHRKGGQAPSDRPRFARFLVEAGIDSISMTPDSFVRVKEHVVQAEAGGARAV
jgi:hypothetical protein